MDKAQQNQIASDLCDNLKKSILENLSKVPENWDGFELRQWVSDYFSANMNYKPITGKRLKDYKNDCLINNLL